MNHTHTNTHKPAVSVPPEPARRHAVLRLLPVAMLVSACGGGGGGGDGSSPLAPILQVGMQRQYLGTATRSVIYVTPSASSPDNTLTYSFVENQSVLQAPATAPAAFDVHTAYTYSVIQDPGTGTVPLSQTVDNYTNLVASDSTQSTTTLGQTVVLVSNDETSDALGTGPYTLTDTTSSTFPSPRNSFSYPLQTGATMTVPQSSAQTITFADVNAAGSSPSNGTNVGYTISRGENDDGSFSFQTAYVNGSNVSITQNADGSGSDMFTSATGSTTTTVSLPAAGGGAATIPIARTVTAATTTHTNYSAADWYPNGGTPSSPLALQAETVVGPTSSLPAACNGALLRANIYEIDTTTTSLNTISASQSVTNTRAFNADGVTVCSLSTQTTSSYALLTGALVCTTTTTTATTLNAIND